MSGYEIPGAVYCTSVKFQVNTGKTRGPRSEDKEGKTRGPRSEDKEGQFRLKKSKKEKEVPEIAPELVVKPRRQFIDFGQNAKFKASFDGSSNTTLTWSKDGVELAADDDHFKIYESDGYYYLEVCNVTIDDNGWYTCTVENSVGSDSASADLEVFEKPQLLSRSPMPVVPEWTKPLTDVTFCVDDENVELECTSKEMVAPSVKWLHNGREVFSGFHMKTQHEGQTTTLVIKKVQDKDQGEFKCVMNGANGVLETCCVVTVIPAEKFEPPVFVKELHDMEVTDGDKLELVVEVKGTPPVRVFWFHNNEEVRVDSPDFLLASLGSVHTLTLPRSTLACAGQFVCEAYNDWGDTDTFCLIHVKEVECPELPHFVSRPLTQSTREDENVTFICQVQGQPLPNVVWEKGGVEITSSHKHKTDHHRDSHTLTIYKVDATDAGEYACHLQSTLGDATHVFNLLLDQEATPGGHRHAKNDTATLGSLKDRYPHHQMKVKKDTNTKEDILHTSSYGVSSTETFPAKTYQPSSKMSGFRDGRSNDDLENSQQSSKPKDLYTAKPIQVDRYGNLIPSHAESNVGQASLKGGSDVVKNGLRDLQMERNLRNVLSRTTKNTRSQDGPITANITAASGSKTHRDFTYHKSSQNPIVSSIGIRSLNKSLSTVGKDGVPKASKSEGLPAQSSHHEKKPTYSPSSSLQFDSKDSENSINSKSDSKFGFSRDTSKSVNVTRADKRETYNIISSEQKQPHTEITYRSQILRTNAPPATHSEKEPIKKVAKVNTGDASNISLSPQSHKKQIEQTNGDNGKTQNNERKSSLTKSGSVFTWSESKSSKPSTPANQNLDTTNKTTSLFSSNRSRNDKNDTPFTLAKESNQKEADKSSSFKVSKNDGQAKSQLSTATPSSFTHVPSGQDDFRSVKLKPATKAERSKDSHPTDNSRDLKKTKYMSKSTDNIFSQVQLKPVSKASPEGRDSSTLSKATASRLRLQSKSSDLTERTGDLREMPVNSCNNLEGSSSSSKSAPMRDKGGVFDTGQPPPPWQRDKANGGNQYVRSKIGSNISKGNDEQVSDIQKTNEEIGSLLSKSRKENDTELAAKANDSTSIRGSDKSDLMEKIRQWKTSPDMYDKSGSVTSRARHTPPTQSSPPSGEGTSHFDRVPDWIKQKALNKRNSLQLTSSLRSELSSSLKSELSSSLKSELSSSLKAELDKEIEEIRTPKSYNTKERNGNPYLNQTQSSIIDQEYKSDKQSSFPAPANILKTVNADLDTKSERTEDSFATDIESKSNRRTTPKYITTEPDSKLRSEPRLGFEKAKEPRSDSQPNANDSNENKPSVVDDSWINRKPMKNIELLIRQKGGNKTNNDDEKPEWTKVRSPREIKLGTMSAREVDGKPETNRFEFGQNHCDQTYANSNDLKSHTKAMKSSSNIPLKTVDKLGMKAPQGSQSDPVPKSVRDSSPSNSGLVKAKTINICESPQSSSSSSSSSTSLSTPTVPLSTSSSVNKTSTPTAKSMQLSKLQSSVSSSALSSSSQETPSPSTMKNSSSTSSVKSLQRDLSTTSTTSDQPSLKNIAMRPSWMKSKSLRHIPIYPIQDNELSPRYEPFRGALDDSSSTISTTSISSLGSDTSNLTNDSGYGKSVGVAELSSLISDACCDDKFSQPTQEDREACSTSTLSAEDEGQATIKEFKDTSINNSASCNVSQFSKSCGNSEVQNSDQVSVNPNETLRQNHSTNNASKYSSNKSYDAKDQKSNFQIKTSTKEESCKSTDISSNHKNHFEKSQANSTKFPRDGDSESHVVPRTARSEFLRNRFAESELRPAKSNNESEGNDITSHSISKATINAALRPSNLDLTSLREPRVKSTNVSRLTLKDKVNTEDNSSPYSQYRISKGDKTSVAKSLNYRLSGNSNSKDCKEGNDGEHVESSITGSTLRSKKTSQYTEESNKGRNISDLVSSIPRNRFSADSKYVTRNQEASNDVDTETREATGINQPSVECESFPVFVTSLVDLSVMYGSKAVLRCRVTGKPTPEVHWLHDRHPIEESKDYDFHFARVTGSVQLTVTETFTDHIGTYTCVATNALGSVCTSCRLTIETSNKSEGLALEGPVSLPPRIISLTPRVATLTRRSTLSLTLTFVGEPNPAVKWIQGEKELTNDERVKVVTQRGSSVLSIAEVTAMDSGKISATVTSSIGSDHASSNVCVEDVPGAPVGKPHVYDIARESASVSWCGPASSGGSQVTYYVIEAKTRAQPAWDVLVPQCKELSQHIFGLVPNSTYRFRVRAANKQGLGPPSEPSERVITADMLRGSLTEESDGNSEVFTPSVEYRRRDELPFEPREVAINTTDVFEDLYETGGVLGKGKFGIVYRCTEKKTGETWAAKVIKCRAKEKAAIKQEVEVMNRLHHPKLLMLWDAFEGPRQMVLVMEMIGAGELFERVIGEDFVLTERDCIHFLRQICEGVSYMHSCHVLHLDLKPENILCISENSNRIKIIDFGLARVFKPGDSVKVMLGTPEFIAPEVINYDEISFATDMWSIGVICYVLLSGLSPFLGDNDMETLSSVTVGEFDFDDEAFDEISDHAKDFISKLLIKKKEKRLLPQECMDHQWLSTDEVDGARYKRLNTDRLRHFMVRRKWLKTGNAVLAVSRLMKSTSLASMGMSRSQSSGSVDVGLSGDSFDTPTSPTLNNVAEEGIAMPSDATTDTAQISQSENSSNFSGKEQLLKNTKDTISVVPSSLKDQNDNKTNDHSASSSTDANTINTLRSSNKDLSNNNNNINANQSQSAQSGTSTVNSSSQSSPVVNGLNGDSQHCSHSQPAAPTFTRKMLDCQASSGDAARFDVVVTGEPSPEVLWYFEEDLIQSDSKYSLDRNTAKGTKSLIIRNIEEDDEGEYFCKASNSSGEIVCSAELSVLVI